MTHKTGKWAMQILNCRNEDGMWGNFHTLSKPVPGKAITSEQAIRRLRVLGYTKEDAPIRFVIEQMCQCVTGERKIDEYSEKTHDWPLFERLMLSAWIRLFDPENEIALSVANHWAAIAEGAFQSGAYRREDDMAAFAAQFGRRPKSGFETGFGMFYHAALLHGVLSEQTERRILEYWLTRPEGMYYIYEKPLCTPPEVFASRETSAWLGALEVLAEYRFAGEYMQFAAECLLANRSETGTWDLGSAAKDGVYLPLSDSWRTPVLRVADCTERIVKLLGRIG